MNYSDRLLDFIEKAVSPFHAVKQTEEELNQAGFKELKSDESWSLENGGKYYVNHHGSTLFAFTLGKKDPTSGNLRIATAHSDFPCLRIKTNPDIKSDGYASLNIEVYGGAILNTWLDRPLSVAGRVAVKSDDVLHPDMRLIDIHRPVLTIPNVAIHINRDVNKGYELNKQKEMLPMAGILPSALAKSRDCGKACSDAGSACAGGMISGSEAEDQGAFGAELSDEQKKALDKDYFLNFLAHELKVKKEDILAFELCAYNCEKGCFVGINDDFISAPRLDNMTSVVSDIVGITEASRDTGVNVMAIFDHEEIGSKTKQGAGSMALSNLIEKIYSALSGLSGQELFRNRLADALLLSVDVGHAFHPYMSDKYDPVNRSLLNSGVVVKEAASQSYATDSEAIAVIMGMLKKFGIPYTAFVNRSDGTSGSTLGSIASSYLPILTIDVGVPLLAMHSARELMGAKDEDALCELLKAFYSV
ncbi:MAG: M18 family aminopeptidase [Lachnospiraceae bacterium]|nr:M18 family aminopeptidase [Lachnospiraceae bacterium]